VAAIIGLGKMLEHDANMWEAVLLRADTIAGAAAVPYSGDAGPLRTDDCLVQVEPFRLSRLLESGRNCAVG
jgi:hypothetical protein